MHTALFLSFALVMPVWTFNPAMIVDDPATITGSPGSPQQPPELNLDPAELIKYWKYPVETQTATTQDGYILNLYRIPKGRNDNSSKDVKRPVVLLLHGFETSAADWLINRPDQSAAFIFADAGFDVWLGNFRGSRYARKHQNWDSTTTMFWQFSLDEQIKYDLPAMINTVISLSKANQIYLVAHSTATTIAFVKLAQEEGLGKKVRQLHALAPLLHMQNVQGPLKFASPALKNINTASALFGVGELKPNKELARSWAKYVCHDPENDVTCKNVLLMISGPNTRQIDESRLDIINAHSPSGTSVQTLVHLAQTMSHEQGVLRAFDFGSPILNKDHYGQNLPPVYNVNAGTLKVQTYFYSSECDWIAEPLDVDAAASAIRTVLVSQSIVPGFNHMDFLWGTRAAREVYYPIMTAIAQDFQLPPKPSN